MGLRLSRYERVVEFLAAAGAFLEAREAEHNLILGLCTNMRRHPEMFADNPPTFLTVADAAGSMVAASIRTPPFNQVLSEMDDPAAAVLIADALADANDRVPGLLAPKAAAAAFVARWRARTGQEPKLTAAERIFRLERVVPPRPAPGSWRVANDGDRQLLADWYVAFAEEAMPDEPRPTDLEVMVDRWIQRVGRTMYLWEEGGAAVCLVGAGGETPHGTRIGPVFTPPDARGRGFASNLTAAVSRAQLAAGRRFCFLFTDLANPTSNKIYQAIGYAAVTDVDQYRFVDA